MTDERLYLWFGMMSRMTHSLKMNIALRYGGIRELWSVPEKVLREELTDNQADIIVENRSEQKVAAYAGELDKLGIKYVYPGHECYPERLYDIPEPPMLLFVRGRPEALRGGQPTVAVVGARKASMYGKNVADRLARGLAENGVMVASGMAMGIDGVAHRAAISAGGVSVAVLGSGINVPYPRENYDIYRDIQEDGAVISESGLDVKPEAFRFPYRNRIISGMADGVLVVEARDKSGSLITADQALEQGRDVYAVPGRITDTLSFGCNELIRQGAMCVTSADDILETLRISGHLVNSDVSLTNEGNAESVKNLLASDEKKVYSCVRLESRHVDDICFEAGITVSEAAQILYELECKRLVKQPARNYYTRI